MNTSEWAKLIDECQNSGISIKLWCEKNGITYRQYRYWANKLQNQTQQWAQVTVKDEGIKCNGVKLYCGKWTIAIENGVSLELLSDVLRAVDTVCS